MKTTPALKTPWHKSGKPAYAVASSYNYDQDVMEIEAATEQEALAFFDAHQGFGKSGKGPPYTVQHQWKNGVLTSYATYVGFD